jgi:hypothetical protein
VLAGVVGALAVLVGVGAATTPAALPAGPAQTTPVEGVTLICPALRSAPAESLGSRVSAGLASGTDQAGGSDDVGAVSAAELGASAAPTPVPLSDANRLAGGLAPGGADTALVLAARGVLAGGLQATQLTTATSGSRRGLAALACSSPTAQSWFVGGSAAPGDTSTLVLANAEDTAAVVDVQVWSAQGPVDPRLGRGVVVPPRGRASVGLDSLAPGLTDLALHVSADRGRVVAAVEHLRGAGGAEWVPASPPPAARVVLPALPKGPGARTLLVTNPGSAPTVVQVQVTTEGEQFVPTGLEALPVPAGSTVRADLTVLLGDTAAAVAVTSRAGPVLAGGLVVDGSGPGAELAYATGGVALAGAAVAPELPGGASTLLLSALDGDASVVVTPAAGGADRTVSVPGGRTVAVPLADLGPPGRAVQVQPAAGSGPVHAVAYLRDDAAFGALSSLLPLVAPLREVTRPAVGADPGAALP